MKAGLRLTCLRQVRGDRKSGPTCLKFLWRENGVNGKRAIACRIILSWCCVPLLAGPLGASHGRRAQCQQAHVVA